MDLKDKLESLFEPALAPFGLQLVLLQVIGTSRNRIKLQIIIDRTDEQVVTMDDCVKASRELSTLLDVEDPIESSYTLEVSSPGEDRPLVKPKDYQRFSGHEIKLETHDMYNGRKRFKGILKSADESAIVLNSELDEVFTFTYDQVAKARLCPAEPKIQPKKRRS